MRVQVQIGGKAKRKSCGIIVYQIHFLPPVRMLASLDQQ
jgi:hypothetical protein